MTKGEGKKVVVAVLPEGGAVAKNKEYLNCVENGLDLRTFLEEKGYEYITTADKEGSQSEVEKLLPEMDILITTPFHPCYMSRERFEKAKKLELVLTAGIGSDHIDLHAAADKGITVAEVTGSNVVSVAEDEVMRMLILIRNFLPGHKQAVSGEWDVPATAQKSWDIQGKTVGTVGGGAIGFETLKRLKSWDVNLLYYGRHRKSNCDELGAGFESDLYTFLAKCDVVTLNVPLTDKTRGMFNKEVIGKMKRGSYLVNNARGSICDTDAIVEALESGHLAGYGGDVWPQQPAPKDHPWRHMPNHAMTPHLSGTTLDAQKRYAAGVRDMLDCWMQKKPFHEDFYIVREGELASQYT